MMKYLKLLWCALFLYVPGLVFAQVTTLAPGEYKSVVIPNYNYNGDYTRNLILLHECYNGTSVGANYAIGTVTAYRGGESGWNRLNVAQVNTSSAYQSSSANVTSNYNSVGSWKLKTCLFLGKRYLALEVPYDPSLYDHGYKFTGWSLSTSSAMLAIAYEVSGQPYNQNVLSEIQDFQPNVIEHHDVPSFIVSGNVGIGTSNTTEKLSVNGNIRAKEVKVTTENWPDYVFDEGYEITSLAQMDAYIKAHKHLPDLPSAKEAEANGIALGEMNKILLKKVEELTLHLIEKDKQITDLQSFPAQLKAMEDRLQALECKNQKHKK